MNILKPYFRLIRRSKSFWPNAGVPVGVGVAESGTPHSGSTFKPMLSDGMTSLAFISSLRLAKGDMAPPKMQNRKPLVDYRTTLTKFLLPYLSRTNCLCYFCHSFPFCYWKTFQAKIWFLFSYVAPSVDSGVAAVAEVATTKQTETRQRQAYLSVAGKGRLEPMNPDWTWSKGYFHQASSYIKKQSICYFHVYEITLIIIICCRLG